MDQYETPRKLFNVAIHNTAFVIFQQAREILQETLITAGFSTDSDIKHGSVNKNCVSAWRPTYKTNQAVLMWADIVNNLILNELNKLFACDI